MKKFVKHAIILSAIFAFLFVIGLEITLAQQSFTYLGSVAGINMGAFSRGNISVKGDKGDIMNFAVGRKTVYIPSRLPGIGERVKVSYYFQRGQNVAYQVEILPEPASPPSKKK
jgi:hypothetical protein